MERDDDIAKVSRALISIDVELNHRERDFILNPKINWKSVKIGYRAQVTWSRARRSMTSRAAAF